MFVLNGRGFSPGIELDTLGLDEVLYELHQPTLLTTPYSDTIDIT